MPAPSSRRFRSRPATMPSAGGWCAGRNRANAKPCSASRRSAFTGRGTSMRKRARWRSRWRSFRRRCGRWSRTVGTSRPKGGCSAPPGRCSSRSSRGSTGSSCTARSTSARDGPSRSPSCSRHCGAETARSSSTTGPGGWCRRNGSGATSGSRRSARPATIMSGIDRHRRRSSMRCWKRSPPCGSTTAFARARAELAQFSGISPLAAPESFRGQLRDYQRLRARLVRVPAPVRVRRLPRRRHGARQDRHGAGAPRRPPLHPRGTRAAHVGRGRAAIAGLQLDGRGVALRAGAAGARLHRRRARGGAGRGLRSAPHHLRDAAAGRGAARRATSSTT